MIWEDYFPPPMLNGYGYRLQSQLMRTPVESGADRTRRIKTVTPSEFNVSFMLDDDECSDFIDKYRNDLNHGSVAFTIQLKNGLGTVSHTVYRMQVAELTKIDQGAWLLKQTLFTMTLNTLTELETELLVVYPIEEITLVSAKLHKLIHTDLPGPLNW